MNGLHSCMSLFKAAQRCQEVVLADCHLRKCSVEILWVSFSCHGCSKDHAAAYGAAEQQDISRLQLAFAPRHTPRSHLAVNAKGELDPKIDWLGRNAAGFEGMPSN